MSEKEVLNILLFVVVENDDSGVSGLVEISSFSLKGNTT